MSIWSNNCNNILLQNISFIYISFAELCTLLIHVSEMTSLTEGVKRSEVICMLAVPAKMTCIELMKFVAPSEWVELVDFHVLQYGRGGWGGEVVGWLGGEVGSEL